MSVHDAMNEACRAVGIIPPKRVMRGRWALADIDGKANGKGDGRVMIDADGQGGVAYNWQTGEHARFRDAAAPASAPRRADPEIERQRIERERAAASLCRAIIKAATPATHSYLARKGFPDELGLVCETLPDLRGQSLGDMEGPYLIVPGLIGKDVTTAQIIGACGSKLNIRGGRMSGAAHRIATGRETWVCEGIATALSVRAALRLLGRSATVLSAFAANNVAKVASAIPGSIIAADHDKPIEALHGKGTGEFYAAGTGRRWVMPPDLGDFNDMHMAEGLRAVALHLKGVA